MKPSTLPLLSAAMLLAGTTLAGAGEISLGTMNRINVSLTCERAGDPVVNNNTRTEMTRTRLERVRFGNRDVLLEMVGDELIPSIQGWGLAEIFDSDGNPLGIFAHHRTLGSVAVPGELLSYSGPEDVVETYSTTFNLDLGATTQDDRRWTGITEWTIDGWSVMGPTMGRTYLRYQRTTPPTSWYIVNYTANVHGLISGESNLYCTGRVISNGGGTQINTADYQLADE